MRNITVYVITTPPPPEGTGKTSVRTKVNLRWCAENGYTCTEADMNWKAVRAIAGIWEQEAGGEPDPDSETPLSEQLAQVLRESIARDELTGKLPTQHELAARYQVSRETVVRALTLLKDEGLVRSHAKRGTWVVPPQE